VRSQLLTLTTLSISFVRSFLLFVVFPLKSLRKSEESPSQRTEVRLWINFCGLELRQYGLAPVLGSLWGHGGMLVRKHLEELSEARAEAAIRSRPVHGALVPQNG